MLHPYKSNTPPPQNLKIETTTSAKIKTNNATRKTGTLISTDSTKTLNQGKYNALPPTQIHRYPVTEKVKYPLATPTYKWNQITKTIGDKEMNLTRGTTSKYNKTREEEIPYTGKLAVASSEVGAYTDPTKTPIVIKAQTTMNTKEEI